VFSAQPSGRIEVIKEGRVTKETEMEIQKPLIPPDDLAEMANLWWTATSKESPRESLCKERSKI